MKSINKVDQFLDMLAGIILLSPVLGGLSVFLYIVYTTIHLEGILITLGVLGGMSAFGWSIHRLGL